MNDEKRWCAPMNIKPQFIGHGQVFWFMWASDDVAGMHRFLAQMEKELQELYGKGDRENYWYGKVNGEEAQEN